MGRAGLKNPDRAGGSCDISRLTALRRMTTVRGFRVVAAVRKTIFPSRRAFMAGEKADVVMFGPKPIIEEALTKGGLNLHKAFAAPDKEAFINEIGPKVRAIAAVAGHGPVNGALMSRFPKLEIVSSFGVGYDHIDAKWAGQHGIIVTNTPDVLNEEVADIALGLTLCTVRHLPQAE